MAKVDIINASKRFGSVQVFNNLDIEIANGEFIALLGPSGCGKSTLLRCIAGLEDLTGGDIRFDDASMVNVSPSMRGAAMVFQSYALYPHKTVADNLGFALRVAGRPREEIQAKVADAARILDIEHLLEKRPRQLSGGQRQRVAIGRAIVRRPEVFLFDEPLSNLDAELRARMRVDLSALQRDLGATAIYVTHDQIEAMTMADRIVLINGGRIHQIGAPQEVFDHPADLFAARFIGTPSMNLFAVKANSTFSEQLERLFGNQGQRIAHIGIRPDDLRVGDGPFKIETILTHSETTGRDRLLHGTIDVPRPDDEHRVSIILRDIPVDWRPGKFMLSTAPNCMHLFDIDGHRVELGVS